MTAPNVSVTTGPTRDLLISGTQPIADDEVTILAGAAFVRGTVLGRITASDKYTLSASAAGNGSEVPSAILLHDIPADVADRKASVAFTGQFNPDALTLGAGHTIASIRFALRQVGIFLKTMTKGS